MPTIFGPAVHGDFFAVGGEHFPDDARVVFRHGVHEVTVEPDLVRPHWLLVDRLPGFVTVGKNRVHVASGRGPSMDTEVEVAGFGAAERRTIYPGRDAPNPFTIAFIANPFILTADGGLAPDPVLTDRPAFHQCVAGCLKTLLTLKEDLLRHDGLEKLIRFATLFEPEGSARTDEALVEQYLEFPIMLPRRATVAAFLKRRGLAADVVYVIHGSATHTIASANYTQDAREGPQLEYRYDNVRLAHGLFTDLPGCVAFWAYENHRLPVALHEFAHASSEGRTGRIIDAYVDGPGSSLKIVNKKYRKRPRGRIPSVFCTYGTGPEKPRPYASDQQRDGLRYPHNWRSYHPCPVNPEGPHLMDDYRLDKVDARRCRFDSLTYRWLLDRLWAKANR
jgi:hypothetical protein